MTDKKKAENIVKCVDFTDLTPEMSVEARKANPLYEKAFLAKEEKPSGEYSRNTATWE